MRAHRFRAALPVALALLLAGCGAVPASGPSSVPASTGVVDPASGPVGDGAPHERENTRYRDRAPIAAASVPVLIAARTRVLRALDATPGAPTEAGVRAALASADAADGGVWVARDAATGDIAFETQVGQSGCLVGRVPATGDPAVDPAGFVLDGGCHALTGH